MIPIYSVSGKIGLGSHDPCTGVPAPDPHLILHWCLAVRQTLFFGILLDVGRRPSFVRGRLRLGNVATLMDVFVTPPLSFRRTVVVTLLLW